MYCGITGISGYTEVDAGIGAGIGAGVLAISAKAVKLVTVTAVTNSKELSVDDFIWYSFENLLQDLRDAAEVVHKEMMASGWCVTLACAGVVADSTNRSGWSLL